MSAKSKIRQIRVSPEEDARLQELARAKGVTVSDLLRDGALKRRVPSRGAAFVAAGSEPLGAAELEGASEGVSGSAAPGSPATRDAPAAAGSTAAADGAEGSSAAAVFRCPAFFDDGINCGFEARSPAVRCPVHGAKVVAA